jgi:DNA-directed RNA polymerase specialized sigma24 family protein
MQPKPKTAWPPIETGYTEEFGPVDIEVYNAAGLLWPSAERLAIRIIGDQPDCRCLMLRAVAAVSQARSSARSITSLSAYLFQSFKRLLLAELEKANGQRDQQMSLAHQLRLRPTESAAKLDQMILVQQLVRMMDGWTRDVFELLVVGHSFAEIGEHFHSNGHAVGKRYRDRLQTLRLRIEADSNDESTLNTRLKSRLRAG